MRPADLTDQIISEGHSQNFWMLNLVLEENLSFCGTTLACRLMHGWTLPSNFIQT